MSPRKASLFTVLASTALASLVVFAMLASSNPRNHKFAATNISPAEIESSPSAYPSSYLPVQTKNTKFLGAGKVLVASRELGDPHFVRTVILLVHYDAQGVVGLILNRRTEVPISRALDGLKEAKNLSDHVYVGGPVEMPAAFGLLQSSGKVEGAERVFGDVYLITAKNLFEQTLSARPNPDRFHVYVGYAGWSNEQLKKEVELGAWFIFPGDANTVFSADPDTLWPKMIGKTELEMARSEPASPPDPNLKSAHPHLTVN
jgi:putative AlgH/UPF0301 family transcriptional regulator